MHDIFSGLTWGGMDKRRSKGVVDAGKVSVATLARAFPGCARTGKRSGQHPSDIRMPYPAAFAHATHPPIPSCTRVLKKF